MQFSPFDLYIYCYYHQRLKKSNNQPSPMMKGNEGIVFGGFASAAIGTDATQSATNGRVHIFLYFLFRVSTVCKYGKEKNERKPPNHAPTQQLPQCSFHLCLRCCRRLRFNLHQSSLVLLPKRKRGGKRTSFQHTCRKPKKRNNLGRSPSCFHPTTVLGHFSFLSSRK
jgi:hypothetical protein